MPPRVLASGALGQNPAGAIFINTSLIKKGSYNMFFANVILCVADVSSVVVGADVVSINFEAITKHTARSGPSYF